MTLSIPAGAEPVRLRWSSAAPAAGQLTLPHFTEPGDLGYVRLAGQSEEDLTC